MEMRNLFKGLAIVLMTTLLSSCWLEGWPPTGPLGETAEGMGYYEGVYALMPATFRARMESEFYKGTDGNSELINPIPQDGFMVLVGFGANHGTEGYQQDSLNWYVYFFGAYNAITKTLSDYRGGGWLSFEGYPSYTFSIYGGFGPMGDYESGEFMSTGHLTTMVDRATPGANNDRWRRMTRLAGNIIAWLYPDYDDTVFASAGIDLPRYGEAVPLPEELLNQLDCEKISASMGAKFGNGGGYAETVGHISFSGTWIADLEEVVQE